MKALQIILLIFIVFSNHYSQIPNTIAFQGVLSDTSGNVKPDGAYQIHFNLYDDSLALNSIWGETQNLHVDDGVVYARLGSQNQFTNSVEFNKQYWLGITLDNENEMLPRIPLNAVPYSIRSAKSDTADYAYDSPANTSWEISGNDIFRLNGRLGLGTFPAGADFHIKSAATALRIDLNQQQDYEQGFIISTYREWSKNLSFLLNDEEQAAVYGNGSAYILGRLSIGSTPKWGMLNVTSVGTGLQLDLNHEGNFQYGIVANTNNGTTKGFVLRKNDSDKVVFYGDGSAFIQGRVGIGSAVPADFALAVDGKIKTKEVLVTLDNWPDYVFSEGYNLSPINEVKNFIDQNNHLPGMPTAEEVEMNGASLGDVQKRLLEKVEELTLYLIEQNERLENLERENELLISKLSTLEK